MADRDAHLTDPAFRDVPVDAAASTRTTRPTLAARIDPHRARPARRRRRSPLGGGTIYLAVVDARRATRSA